MIISPLVAIGILGVLIALHEAGHALVAIACRVPLAEFAIGFGPVCWATHLRGTRLSWRMIPVGGFIRFAPSSPAPSRANEASDLSRAPSSSAGAPRPFADPLAHIPPGRRVAIALGGPAGSIVAGGLCFLLAHLGWGIPPRPALDAFDTVAAAQFTPGLATALQLTTSPHVLVAVDHQTPLPLAAPTVRWQRVGVVGSLFAARDATWQATRLMGEMTWWLLANPPVLYESLGGPVGIVSRSAEVAVASQAAREADRARLPMTGAGGIADSAGRAAATSAHASMTAATTRGYALLLFYFGFVSVAMAFLNLMPLPPFDGFHASIATLELLARRRFPQRLRIATALIGAVLLAGLLARGTWNDFQRTNATTERARLP